MSGDGLIITDSYYTQMDDDLTILLNMPKTHTVYNRMNIRRVLKTLHPYRETEDDNLGSRLLRLVAFTQFINCSFTVYTVHYQVYSAPIVASMASC